MTTDDRSPADSVVELLRRRQVPDGSLVIDLGRGGDALRRALAPLGLVCVAVPPEPPVPAASEVQQRPGGIEVTDRAISTWDEVFAGIKASLHGRRVAAVVLGDTPSRAPDAAALLEATRRFCLEVGEVPVIVHVANVTHLDVATKLLIGRWDPAAGTIVSPDQVRHFSEDALTSLMSTHGFAQLDAQDLSRGLSNQHFPDRAVPLEQTTLIGSQLAALRRMAGRGPFTTHFVRLFEPTWPLSRDTGDVHTLAHRKAGDAGAAPFLSVLLRTQGERWEMLQESLLCLAAQTCDDFETLLLLHDATQDAAASLARVVEEFHPSFARRVRIIEVHGGGRARPLNVGALAARGQYLAMLDDDDLVFAHWVESFRTGAAQCPGHVVRTPVASQLVAHRPTHWDGGQGYEVIERPRLFYALAFDHVDHLVDNRTPNNGYAVPRSLVVDLDQGWDESLPVLEDWDHLLRAASLCGVVSVPVITALMRPWSEGEDSKSRHAWDDWEATRRRIIERHDAGPLVLDVGSFSKIRELADRLDASEAELADTRRHLHAASAELLGARSRLVAATVELADVHHRLDLVQHSRSWRLTRPIRIASGGARALRRTLRRLGGTDARHDPTQ